MKAWIQVVAAPFFAGLIFGLLIYTQYSDTTTLFIALSTSVIGLLMGLSWATRIWSKERTLQLISRIIASHRLDEKDQTSRQG
jgi:hypothetical protein